MNTSDDSRPIVGVSACLLGQCVRYDGAHKRHGAIADVLARDFRLIPVCPEVEIGLGTPREPIQLVDEGGMRVRGVTTRMDHTEPLRRFAERKVRELAELGICGYVLKRGSPSCGLAEVPVHSADAPPSRTGRGAFAHVLVLRFPRLPICEERDLDEASNRDAFIRRVRTYANATRG